MALSAPWQELGDELARWPEPPLLWLRDDDAVRPTPALATLVDLCAESGIPLCAAAIPAQLDDGLAGWFDERDAEVAVVAHGWAHRNHAPADEKKAEFGDHRAGDEIADDLRQARQRIEEAFGERARPVFVPPWNRFGDRAAGCLAAAGYAAVSAMDSKTNPAVTGVTVAHVHIDIIDWKGGRAFRGVAAVLGDLCARLADLRTNQRGEPTGILTHHAVHDPAAWDFLRALPRQTGPGIRWGTVDDAVAACRV